MNELNWHLLMADCIKFFFLLTPFAGLATYLALTKQHDIRQKRRLATRATVAVWIASLILLFAGQWIFGVLGITLDAFRIGAGALLFLNGVALQQPSQMAEGRDPNEDIAVVPLAIPVLLGPATIGTIMVMGIENAGTLHSLSIALSLTMATILVGCLLLAGSWMEKKLGHLTINVLSKLSGLILASLAAQMIITGLRSALK